MSYWMGLFKQANQDNLGNRLAWPERSDIQPANCRELLGDMFILDIDNGLYNFRLAGTRLCSIFGKELKGDSFVETLNDQDHSVAENWVDQMAHDDFTTLICAEGVTATGKVLPLETLLLPLNHFDKRSRRLLGITIPLEVPYWMGEEPIIEVKILSVRVLRPWEEDGQLDSQSENASQPAIGIETPMPRSPTVPLFSKKSSFSQLARSAASFGGTKEVLENSQPHPKASHLRVLEGGKK